jgi:hypothetical protein
MSIQRWIGVVVLALFVSAFMASRTIAQVPPGSTTYYFCASSQGQSLGDHFVMDTGQTSGPWHIYRVVNPVTAPQNPQWTWINGGGPAGQGDYRTMVIIPSGEDEIANIYFYISGL